jgi:hypothetical protein
VGVPPHPDRTRGGERRNTVPQNSLFARLEAAARTLKLRLDIASFAVLPIIILA